MAYITKDEVKNYIGLNFTSALDAFVDTVISSVTAYIEQVCGDEVFGKRTFEAPSPDNDATRYFDGNGATKMQIGDLRSLTTLIADGETLTVNEDFYTYPLNASALGVPIQWIELIQPETRVASNSRLDKSSPYIFEKGQRLVEVTGKWGYSATPPADVKLAAMKLVGGVLKENIGDNDLKEMTQESLGEYSVSFAKVSDIAHALGVDTLLAQYKRKGMRAKSGFIKAS